MAKFAIVTYGSSENKEVTKNYVYVVNNNVRTHDKIYPSVKHWKNGAIFGTTAVVKHAYLTQGKMGQEIGNDVKKETGDEARKVMTSPESQYKISKNDPSFKEVIRKDNILNTFETELAKSPDAKISRGQATVRAMGYHGRSVANSSDDSYDEYAQQFIGE